MTGVIMGVLQARRVLAAIGCSLALLTTTGASAAPAYSEQQLRLLYDEATAIGAATYTFYILGSKDESVIRSEQQKLMDPRLQFRSMKTLLNMMPAKGPAFTLPSGIRDHLRLLNEAERSDVFRLDSESWVMVELESINSGSPMPPFERVRSTLPRLVEEGALPDPELLASDPELVQRSQLNRVNSARDFDKLPPGIDPDLILSSGYTLLQQALLREDVALLDALLKRRANTNLCPMRACPLQIAARSAQNGAVFTQKLLAAGARPDQITVVSGEDTALTFASRLGNFEVVKLLLAAGADVNGGPGGIPPLSLAVYKGHVGVAKLLLDSGADPLFSKAVGGATTSTPLSVAFNNEKPEMIALLRGVAVKKLGDLQQYKWSGWLEQDGQRFTLDQGIIRLKRKPFSVNVKLQSGAALHVHSATGTRIFDEFRTRNLRTPLDPPRRHSDDTHDGAAQWLLVSDDKAPAAGTTRASGIQAWAWGQWDKDFNRVDKGPQGDVYVRTISQVVPDSDKGAGKPVAIEQANLPGINMVMGTAMSYDKTTAEFVNPVAFKILFDN
ncbi:MAG: hypothetical protein K0S46_2510 [Moraxellaceae bacterium]|nr:hypothetical protein [Moraxellaceae bacterium]